MTELKGRSTEVRGLTMPITRFIMGGAVLALLAACTAGTGEPAKGFFKPTPVGAAGSGGGPASCGEVCQKIVSCAESLGSSTTTSTTYPDGSTVSTTGPSTQPSADQVAKAQQECETECQKVSPACVSCANSLTCDQLATVYVTNGQSVNGQGVRQQKPCEDVCSSSSSDAGSTVTVTGPSGSQSGFDAGDFTGADF
jgi:hypothetical protein